jgi:TRAP-type C4-dicarboxylate transport system substrate-binding protein
LKQYLISRRNLIKSSLKYGSALALTGASSNVFSTTPHSDLSDDFKRKLLAKYIMTFGSPYVTENAHYSPHMHQEFKKNVEEMTKGQVYVEISDKGASGIGPVLMANIAHKKVVAGLVSVSNLAPIAPELDILNIPFWSAESQHYVNLVTSPIWNRLILDKIRAKGAIDVLFHYVVCARSATSTRMFREIIKTPSNVRGVAFRIPSSKTLGLFYRLAGARPIKIDWGDTAEGARKRRFYALDPGIIGLYNGPDGLKNELFAISQIDSVHDGWMAVINKHWLDALPAKLRLAVLDASEITFREEIKKVSVIKERCISAFKHLDTQIYMPTTDEKQEWMAQCGYKRPEWTPVKKAILGDASLFDKLIDATRHNNGYTVG